MKKLLAFFTCLISINLTYKAQAIIDPTKPPTISAVSVPTDPTEPVQLTLQAEAIIKSSKGYKAIINNMPYVLGDKINNLTIAKITDDAIYLSDGTTEFILNITQPESTGILTTKSKNK